MIRIASRGGCVFLFIVAAAASFSLLLPLAAYCGKLSDLEIQQHLADGEKFFRKAVELDRVNPGDARDYYLKSILRFERIVEDGGIHSGRLYYNIGNTYFRLGDLGRAILNYKRAALYNPHDSNLKQNLEFARSRRADKIEKKQREKVFKTLFFLHYDIPSRIRLMIFIVSFAVVWACAALLLFVRMGGIRLALILSSVISALLLVSLTVEAINLSRRPEGVIVTDEVIARKGDAETYQPSFTEPLHSGTEYRLVTERSGWWHIELENGARCWVPSGSGELVLDSN